MCRSSLAMVRFTQLWHLHPMTMSVVAGLVCALLVSLVGFITWHILGADGFGRTAVPPNLLNSSFIFVLFGVLLIPALENLVVVLLPVEIVRRVGASPGLTICICAVLFAVGHGLNGGAGHAATTFVAGGIFAAVYLIRRSRGIWAAFLASWITHGANNLAVFLWIATIKVVE